jgi:hypothetical protein
MSFIEFYLFGWIILFIVAVLLLGVIRAINDLYIFVVVKVAPKVKPTIKILNKKIQKR